MSIDELGRAAAAEARRAAASRIDARTMLDDLHHRSRVRTVGTIGVVVAVCAAVVVSLLLVSSGKPTAERPAHTGEPQTTPTSDRGCAGGPLVQCFSGRRVLVTLPVPVTVHAPANFHQDASLCGPAGFTSDRKDVTGTFVTVMENAVPVKDDSSWTRDPAAGTSAASMAQWLAARPFLTHPAVKSVTVDGLVGNQVSAQLKPAASLPANWGTSPAMATFVAPTFAEGDCHAGYRPNIFGTYTLLDVPGAGVTVIWSWTIERNQALVDDNQPLIDGLSFG